MIIIAVRSCNLTLARVGKKGELVSKISRSCLKKNKKKQNIVMLIHYSFRHKITAIFWGREINSHQGLVIRHVKKKRKKRWQASRCRYSLIRAQTPCWIVFCFPLNQSSFSDDLHYNTFADDNQSRDSCEFLITLLKMSLEL